MVNLLILVALISLMSMSINEERFGHWKDTALRLDGSAVQTLKALFLTMWTVTGIEDKRDMERYLQEKPQQRKSQGFVLPYGNSPLTYHKVAEDVYLHLLNTSTDYVHIMTPYLILDDELVRAMTFAAKRWSRCSDHYARGFQINNMPLILRRPILKVLLNALASVFSVIP